MDWKIVYTTTNSYRAELIKQALVSAEIDAIILNKQDSSYFIGEIYVSVSLDNLLKAKYLVEEFEKQADFE
ncbi:MAG TPA: DUF2007 domain-containing protein [Bacteroidales bacterium]|nr:DUF2007 domain-containing protein [Bacteroidales bacterium]